MGQSGKLETLQQESLSPGTPPNVDDGQVLTRGKTFPKARRGVTLLSSPCGTMFNRGA